jgi:hypothetical protein
MLLNNSSLIAGDLTIRDWALLGVSAACIILTVATSPGPVSYCDTSPDRLDRVRVNTGLVVGWLVAVQAILTKGNVAWLETPIWACLIAVLLSFVTRVAKSRSDTTIVG